MTQSSEASSFIRALSQRLEAILPNRTGFSLAEVELNSQFIITTNLILKSCKPNDFNGNQEFFSGILISLVDLMEKLNMESNPRRLIERSQNALASTVILSRLLYIICITNWDPERTYTQKDDLSLDMGIRFNANIGVSRDFFQLYRHPEPPALQIDTDRVLSTLFALLSPEVNTRALADIRKLAAPVPKLEYNVSADHTLLRTELRAQILEIDANIQIVLRYIAASNPKAYSHFVWLKLFQYIDQGEPAPVQVLQRYACLLLYVYCTPNNISFYLKKVYSLIPYVRLKTWKQLLLHYESLSLRTQCINKPGFYSNVIYAGSTAEQECKMIFDYLATAFESDVNTNTSLFAWYVILCPSDFDEILLKTHKIKQVFNKRVKFLGTVLKELQAGFSLDCFESMISIFLLGSLLTGTDCGVRQFSTKYLDETYERFLAMRPKCVNDSSLSRFRKQHQKLFTAAIVISPDKYIPMFISQFHRELKGKSRIFYDLTSMLDAQDSLEVMWALSRHDRYRGMFDRIMKEINPTILSIMIACSQILASPGAAKDGLSSDTISKRTMSTIDDDQDSSLYTWLAPSGRLIPDDQFPLVESIMKLALDVYTEGPQYLLGFQFQSHGTQDEKVAEMVAYSKQIFFPLDIAFHSLNPDPNGTFGAACNLTMKLLQFGNEATTSDEIHCISISMAHQACQSICDAIGSLSRLSNKEQFLFLRSFLLERMASPKRSQQNGYYTSTALHADCENTCISLDKLLMLCLCTHDIQFFSLLKLTMQAHTFEQSSSHGKFHCFHDSLAESFSAVMGDDLVFTGFVSLHKKFKSILADFKPTKGLYEAWRMIHSRWTEMIDDKTFSDDSFIFKHYTEFLAGTSGCFIDGRDSTNCFGSREEAKSLISSFYDKSATLLKREELFIRVVIREALSTEAPSAVYQMIYDKLIDTFKQIKDEKTASKESIRFVEEMVSIFTAILKIESDDAFILTVLLPEVVESFFEYVHVVPNPVDQIKLKLRLCKLTSTVSSRKADTGLSGAHKLRNLFAKTAADWLGSAITQSSELATNVSNKAPSNGRASDLEFLQIELATECAKCFALQLESLKLMVPDGTKEAKYEQAKNLVFSNYFSLSYRIFQMFHGAEPSPLLVKSKFKILNMIDYVLKAISNMLKANVGIGLQFALPLGFHENDKIRLIFLDMFATTLSARKLKLKQEKYSDERVARLAEVSDVFGAASSVASPAEHNLLATSLNGLFGYTMGLDRLFVTLLRTEMKTVSRASDIFRGNSTLTRLMSIFAKEYGTPYLSVVLRPFVEEMIDNEIIFEVERENTKEDTDLFIKYLRKLVNNVINSMEWVPEPFKFICCEIYKCVGESFDESALIAVGSFLFLRFFCPAIVSPESFFDLSPVDQKVKRSLMQIVKAIQYMANGSIANLRWVSLADKSKDMSQMNDEIFAFMRKIATDTNDSRYVFHRITLKPLANLRYIHKFFYTYFVEIRHKFLASHPSSRHIVSQEDIDTWRKVDLIMTELGNPKSTIALQGTKSFKILDSNINLGNSEFAEFMAKMSAKNIETSIESPIIRNTAFHDGTPTIVITFRYIKEISYDVSTLVYLFLESVSQVWEREFYCVIDLTQFFYMGIIGKIFASLMKTYAPKVFFKNCARTYVYNLPRESHISIVKNLADMQPRSHTEGSFYLYSEQDSPELIENLCLGESTVSIPLDVKFVCKTCKLYDDITQQFTDVTVKIGRLCVLIWFQRKEYKDSHLSTTTLAPVEVLRLTDLVKCEISNKSDESNEFTLTLNRYNYQVTLVTPQRQEILRFLYFAMLRASRKHGHAALSADETEYQDAQRFGAISTLLFHGLLQKNDEVRTAASNLLKSFSSFFEIDFDQSSRHFVKMSFPSDMTDFVVEFSTRLAEKFPHYTYEFLKAFLTNFDKLSTDLKISGVLYVSPWVSSLHEHISVQPDGFEKLGFIVRQFCKLTVKNPLILPAMRNLVWRRLFKDMRMTGILVDELLAISMDKASESDDWNIMISVFYPSVELCGELVSRLHDCISKTKRNDSEIAIQSKILEISMLVKICSSVFFNRDVFSSLYLLDVFFFCTLFIDRSDLDFGHDLQSLVLNTIQSFASRPLISEEQLVLINDTLEFFSSQRAKMLFGLTTRKRGAHVEFSQNYERTLSFEHLFDYLHNFMSKIGTNDDRKFWISRLSLLSKDIAFSGSFFQMRAYSIVCTLARSGVSDSIGGRIMEVLTNPVFDSPDSYFEGSVCFLRLIQGLAHDSVYLPLLSWMISGGIILEFPVNYQAMIASLGHCYREMIGKPEFTRSVFAYKSTLNPLIGRYEKMTGLELRLDNFEFGYLFLMSKGLTILQVRQVALDTIRSVLVKKTQSQGIVWSNNDEDEFALSFLLIYYLSVTDKKFHETLPEFGLEDTPLIHIGRDCIPAFLLEGLCLLRKSLRLAFILAAHIFSSDCEQIFKLKFIALYEKMLGTNRDSALLVFHIIRAKLEDSFVNAASNSLTNDISALLMDVVRDKNYDCKVWQKQILSDSENVGVRCLETVGRVETLQTANESIRRMTLVRKMLYQNLCEPVEGLRLETY